MASKDTGRVGFLWSAGHTVSAAGFPNLAKHMLFSFRSAAASAGLRLADTASRRICPGCSALLIPGQSCTIRLVKKKTKGGQGDRDTGGPTGGGGKIITRTWWDGFSKGRHSHGRNELECKCNGCGTKLCYGGSESKAMHAMRDARGKERRGQRFRDGEVADKQLRLAKASAFIQSEGLGGKEKKKTQKESFLREDGTVALPETMSASAEAQLSSSYGSHVYNTCGYIMPPKEAPAPIPVPASAAAAAAALQAVPTKKRTLDAGEDAKKKKKKKRESLESMSSTMGTPPAPLGGGSAAGGSGQGATGGKKSLYDLMQGILGGP